MCSSIISNLPPTNPVDIYDDDETQAVHRFLSKTYGLKGIPTASCELFQYSYDEVLISNDLIKSPNSSLNYTREPLCKDLWQSIPKNSYDYSIVTMTAISSHCVNQVVPTGDRVLRTEDGQKSWMIYGI